MSEAYTGAVDDEVNAFGELQHSRPSRCWLTACFGGDDVIGEFHLQSVSSMWRSLRFRGWRHTSKCLHSGYFEGRFNNPLSLFGLSSIPISY